MTYVISVLIKPRHINKLHHFGFNKLLGIPYWFPFERFFDFNLETLVEFVADPEHRESNRLRQPSYDPGARDT